MAFDAGLADRVRLIVARQRGIEERKMFGGLAFLLRGNMFCGVVGSDLMVRLGNAGAAGALRRPHTRPMDFTGKPLKSMVYVDAQGLEPDDLLQEWVESALAFAGTLPPKG